MGDEKNKKNFMPEIKNIIMFKFMNQNELNDILKFSEILFYEPEEHIVKQGETTHSLYAVLAGCVKISVNREDEKDIYICTIGPGEVFGEAGLFMKVKRTADVISCDETVVLQITRENLMGFIKKYPVIGTKILMTIIYSLLRKLKEANQELAFERKSDAQQDDIDSIVKEFTDVH